MAVHWPVRGEDDTPRYGSTHQECTLTGFWKGEERIVVGGSCRSLLRTQGKEEAEAILLAVEGTRLHSASFFYIPVYFASCSNTFSRML
jgi:hypothetical protein